MKHKKYKQQTTHQEQPDQMSPSNQSDWMQPADQNPATGKSFWKDRFIPFWMKNKKRNLKNFDQRFCHLDRGRGSSRFTVC